MATGRHPLWLHAICVVFGLGMGALVAGITVSFFLGFFIDDAESRGPFLLVWMLGSVIFYAWPMHLAERARVMRWQREVLRDRVGDLDFEPPSFFRFMRGSETGRRPTGRPSQGPGAELHDVINPPKPSGRRRFLRPHLTAEEQMAHFLKVEEIRRELQAEEPNELPRD